MPAYAYVLIVVGLVIWFYPFIGAHRTTAPAIIVDRQSRWGVLLQFVAFSLLWQGLLWQGHFWMRLLPFWRIAVSAFLFSLACLLSWTSSRALAGQLRVDAALGREHKLVRSGPFALVRNPIYTSMLLVLGAIAVIINGWKIFVAALALFFVGT